MQTTGARAMLDRVVGRRLYLVCGLPGAGKTTRSRQIVERTGALHLCVDEWVVGLGMSLTDYEFREAEGLITVLVRDSSKFAPPLPEEVTRFDRYVGPGDPWH